MPKDRFWDPKLRTAAAMMRLCRALLLVALVPFSRWSPGLGLQMRSGRASPSLSQARSLAADVDWAARRLPLETKCLPRAMALSWALRREGIAHAVVIAVRPTARRQAPDGLHAWVEVAEEKILGDLPGPWIETARLAG